MPCSLLQHTTIIANNDHWPPSLFSCLGSNYRITYALFLGECILLYWYLLSDEKHEPSRTVITGRGSADSLLYLSDQLYLKHILDNHWRFDWSHTIYWYKSELDSEGRVVVRMVIKIKVSDYLLPAVWQLHLRLMLSSKFLMLHSGLQTNTWFSERYGIRSSLLWSYCNLLLFRTITFEEE